MFLGLPGGGAKKGCGRCVEREGREGMEEPRGGGEERGGAGVGVGKGGVGNKEGMEGRQVEALDLMQPNRMSWLYEHGTTSLCTTRHLT